MYNGIKLLPSTRKAKKWMTFHNKKWVHFGAAGYQDFTQHRDLERRRLFRLRNAKWATAKPYRPAPLSYHILW
jgi:hypothetical protein